MAPIRSGRDAFSPRQKAGSGSYFDPAQISFVSAMLLPLHQQTIWDLFFWVSWLDNGELFFPHIKNDRPVAEFTVGAIFQPSLEWTSGIDFTLGGHALLLLTYYSVWNSLKHHWCQSTFDLTFRRTCFGLATPPCWVERTFYTYCIHERLLLTQNGSGMMFLTIPNNPVFKPKISLIALFEKVGSLQKGLLLNWPYFIEPN